jgi:hypothetical protein
MGTSNTFMFWVFYLFLYLLYVLSPCHVIQVQPHCCICPRDLKSAYEGEHMIFGLLSLADLAQNDVLQFHHLLEVLSMHVWIWNIETCWNLFKKRSGRRGKLMERMNQTGVQYRFVWICHNEIPPYNYHTLIKLFSKKQTCNFLCWVIWIW